MNKNYTVLIIDDKKENLKYLNEILKDEKYTVKASTDANFAINSSKINPPDLILLDIKMPEINGFEVCKLLKKENKLKDIPIIFISALDDINSKVKAFEEGGVDYITKPFEKEEVKARVKTQLKLFEKKQTIENLLIQQDFFLKKIIHEMNTPLSIISLNIDNLETDLGPKEQFEAIKASSKSLSSIYNDLYYLIKKEKRIQEIESINLINFLSSRVMFYNTLSNAIKYSTENSIIDIILDENYLEIKDFGTGIEDTNAVFNAYYQQKNANIGLGLGLSIVKDICDRYKIEINVKSDNNGTSFIYTFPQNLIKEN
jgi:DNA-binding response OmpR family regulator